MAKKTLNLDNPAMQFISTPTEDEAKTDTIPDGYKISPYFIEKRSKRLQLLLQPSLYEKIKMRADRKGCSVNDLIHNILENATKGDIR